MRVCNLSSGSDGNLTYIETEYSKILVDIGLSCKETERRLGFLKVAPEKIDAIFITHEHADHIKGLEVFANKYKTKVFVHQDGVKPLQSKLKRNIEISAFTRNFDFKGTQIQFAEVPHDVERCTAYSFIEHDRKMSVATDIGHITPELMDQICGSSLVFWESNHDVNMLKANPRYPIYLKQRILGERGHLSNNDSSKGVLEFVKAGARQIILSHLSTENNSPELAFNSTDNYLKENGILQGKDVRIDIAETFPKAIFKL